MDELGEGKPRARGGSGPLWKGAHGSEERQWVGKTPEVTSGAMNDFLGGRRSGGVTQPLRVSEE